MNINGGGDNDNNVLQPGQQISPVIGIDLTKDLVKQLYGVTIKEIHELNAYDDKNFHLLAEDIENPYIEKLFPHGYVFKVLNSLDSKNLLLIEGQNEVMHFLMKHHIMCPNPVPNVYNSYYSIVELQATSAPSIQPPSKHIVRLLEYQPGTLFCHVPMSRELFYDAGKYLANLDHLLKDFTHAAYASHKSLWSLSSVPDLKKFLFAVKNLGDRTLVGQIIESFENDVMPCMDNMEKGMLHGDFNEQNILCAETPDGTWNVAGILDFGDSHFSCYVFELAIAMCYMMLHCKDMDPNEVGGQFLAGYSTIRQLPKTEMNILRTCIAARYAQSLVLGAYSYSLNPKNDYVLTTAKIGWTQLKNFWSIPAESLHSVWDAEMKKYGITVIAR